jgi:hypothetical protein
MPNVNVLSEERSWNLSAFKANVIAVNNVSKTQCDWQMEQKNLFEESFVKVKLRFKSAMIVTQKKTYNDQTPDISKGRGQNRPIDH